MMETKGKIYELLPKIAAEIGPVAKSRRNQQQGYNFRGIEDVMNAINPVLTRHGVTILPHVRDLKREERQTQKGGTLIYTTIIVAYTFFADDGSNVEAVVCGEGMDSGDKSSNKAMSAAFKYALGQVFSIPFDTTDSENENPEPGKQQQQAPPPQQQQQALPANGQQNGNGSANKKKVTEAQVKEMQSLAFLKGVPEDKLAARFGGATLADLTFENYQFAVANMKKMADKQSEATV